MSDDSDLEAQASDTAVQRAVRAVMQGESAEVERLPLTEEERRLVDELTPWLLAWPAQGLRDDAAEAAGDGPPRADGDATSVPLWAPLDSADPVAQMLGLIPNAASTVDAQRLSKARRAAALTLQDLVGRLNAQGWNVEMSQAFRWERTSTPLAPAMVEAIAQVVEVDVARLLGTVATVADVFTDDAVQQALAEWASEVGWSVGELTSRVRTTLAGAAQRNAGQPSVDAILAILTQLRSTPGFLGRS